MEGVITGTAAQGRSEGHSLPINYILGVAVIRKAFLLKISLGALLCFTIRTVTRTVTQ
jgi:hypothetical protein